MRYYTYNIKYFRTLYIVIAYHVTTNTSCHELSISVAPRSGGVSGITPWPRLNMCSNHIDGSRASRTARGLLSIEAWVAEALCDNLSGGLAGNERDPVARAVVAPGGAHS